VRAVRGLWVVPCPRGAGWDTSPPPVVWGTASRSAAPGTAPRLPSCGGEKVSAASAAASPPFPSSHRACAWGPAGQAGLKKAGVLRCCWTAASDSYAYVDKTITKENFFQS